MLWISRERREASILGYVTCTCRKRKKERMLENGREGNGTRMPGHGRQREVWRMLKACGIEENVATRDGREGMGANMPRVGDKALRR